MSTKNSPVKYTEEYKKTIVSAIPIGENLRPNSERIRRILVRTVQLGSEIFPGKGG